MTNLALRLILNFVIVFTAITLFMAPFYLVFRYHHRGTQKYKNNFNWSLEQFFASTEANYLVFFWALGEATVWFVIPEFLLLLVIFMRVHRKLELVIYDIYGTVCGTLIALAVHPGPKTIERLPFVWPSMINHVATWYGRYGIGGLMFQPFSGVPYKVFAYMAADYHFFVPLFLLFAVLVRIARYYIVYSLFQALYPVLHKYVYRNYVPLFIAAVFVFSALLVRISLAYR